jgi:antitoxin (DNA-binding transcriptional repressor) of toxin-antitoxin stability system
MRTAPDLGCVDSLFQQPWLLDAVARGGWEEITVTQNGRVLARLPYVRRRRRGLTVLGPPPLTQTLGPWIEPSRGKPASAHGREMALLSELAERIPPEGSMLQGVESVNRRFGARQTPYLIVARDGRRMRAAMAVRELVRAAAGGSAA